MSFGLDLSRICNHKVVQEDKVLEDDKVSVILNRPLNNTSDIIVRLNDFKRSESFMTEVLIREDVTSQFIPFTFTISGITVLPVIGDQYSNNSSIFQIVYIDSILLKATRISGTNDPLFSGTLARVSGSGDLNIVFSAVINANPDTIVVNSQIYDGLKIGHLAAEKNQVTVRINVTDEDVSEQFSGIENYFVVQGKPLLQSDAFDFTLAEIEDVVVIHNGVTLTFIQTVCVNSQPFSLTNGSKLGISIAGGPVQWATFNTADFADITQATAAEVAAVLAADWPSTTVLSQSGRIVVRADYSFTISDGVGSPNIAFGFSTSPIVNDGDNAIEEIDAVSGRVQLNFIPLLADTVTVTYYFKASIKTLDAFNSTIILKQKPVLGQEVDVAYYSRINDGWFLKDSTRSMLPGAKDVVFYRSKNSSRSLIVKEDVTDQFTGAENYFQTEHYPILPLYQQFGNTFEQTLYNSLTVFVNGVKTQIMRLDAERGLVALYVRPQLGEIVECTYYYENYVIPDRVSVDYSVDRTYCQKCAQHKYLLDYIVDVLGNYAQVKDEFKLKQDLKKIIVTIKGSDHVALWYGTIFETIIGKKLLPEYSKTRISGEIVEALSKLKNAQIKQQDYQEVTDREFLDFIQSLTVEQDSVDTTYYKATVDVVTQAGTGFTTTQAIGG